MPATYLKKSIGAPASPERLTTVQEVLNVKHNFKSMTSVQQIDNGPFAVGSKARIRQSKLLPAIWQVSEFDPATNFTWATHTPGVQISPGTWSKQPQLEAELRSHCSFARIFRLKAISPPNRPVSTTAANRESILAHPFAQLIFHLRISLRA